MQRILTLLAIFYLGLAGVNAQEQGIYRHYSIYPTLINPGATGLQEGRHEFLGNMVNSWSGAPGTPVNYTFGYSGSFGNNVGLGLQLMNESNAAINRFKAAINYAYKLQFEGAFLSIGMTTEFQQKKLRNGILEDPAIDPSDSYLLAASEGVKYFDFGLGIHARINESFNFGIALPNMVHAYINKPEVISEDPGKFFRQFRGLCIQSFHDS